MQTFYLTALLVVGATSVRAQAPECFAMRYHPVRLVFPPVGVGVTKDSLRAFVLNTAKLNDSLTHNDSAAFAAIYWDRQVRASRHSDSVTVVSATGFEVWQYFLRFRGDSAIGVASYWSDDGFGIFVARAAGVRQACA